ncbi:hypothetical protein [Paenibacillus azoreducens]|uniref:hypothetical protein n=1 Tax=Paenibacillus azoreducens TaxID=116718 RepID=UPI001BB376A6|nr:hypothetical protein [Paenibacillus azoreducens]
MDVTFAIFNTFHVHLTSRRGFIFVYLHRDFDWLIKLSALPLFTSIPAIGHFKWAGGMTVVMPAAA